MILLISTKTGKSQTIVRGKCTILPWFLDCKTVAKRRRRHTRVSLARVFLQSVLTLAPDLSFEDRASSLVPKLKMAAGHQQWIPITLLKLRLVLSSLQLLLLLYSTALRFVSMTRCRPEETKTCFPLERHAKSLFKRFLITCQRHPVGFVGFTHSPAKL